jgi:PAS domain S-box-containing protein
MAKPNSQHVSALGQHANGTAAEVSELRAEIARLKAEIAEQRRPPAENERETVLDLAACLEQSPDCFGIFAALRDAKGHIVDFRIEHLNHAACQNNCLPLEEQIGRNLCELLPGHRKSDLFRHYCSVVESGEPQYFESKEYSDRYAGTDITRAFDIRAFKYRDGFAAIWRDVTGRKREEAKLIRQRNLLRNILDSTEEAIFLKDHGGRFLLLNRAAAGIFGHPEYLDEQLGFNDVLDAIGEAPIKATDAEFTPTQNVFHSASVTRCEEMLTTPEGPRSLSTVQVPFDDPSGGVHGTVGIARDVTEQLAAEAKLRESRERLRAALAAANTGTFRWEIETGILTWDENLDRLFGLPPGETVSSLQAFIELVHPEDRNSVAALCRRSAEEGIDFHKEFRVVWPDGSTHWLEDRGKTFFDDEGRPVYMTGACVDVTERRQILEALRASEQRFRHLADAMPQIVWISNPQGQVTYFNQHWTTYTGIPLERSLGLDCIVAHHPDESAQVLEAWSKSMETGRPFENEHRLRGRDGIYRWHLARSVPVLDENGKVLQWFGTATNIHEHKEALQRLTFQQAQLALTHDAVGAGSFEYNFETDVNTWSPELAKLYGQSSLVGSRNLNSWRESVIAEDLPVANAALAASLESGTLSVDFRIRRPDGEVRWIHARGHVTKAPDGRPLRMIGINLDVTERKSAEIGITRAREEAERANRAKDAFLAALSHELRTPLTPVLMTVQLLEQDATLPDHVREDLRNVRRNVEIETRLIDDLLDLTRITRGKLPLQAEQLDLHEVLHHAIETSRDDMFLAKCLDLRIELEASQYGCVGDPARLGQIFWNLIKNAAKFTPHNGVITIRTSNPRPGEIAVDIADTGIGIPAEALPHIFNAFEQGGAEVTQQFGGLGLGLAICRTLTELHGGMIIARSEGSGLGSTFSVILPAGPLQQTPAVNRESTRIAPPNVNRAGSRRVLLVEDHEQTGRILMRLLRRFGYDVAWASTVAEAKQFASLKKFDLVVSDLGLPDGTGHELMCELRDRHGLKGLALSGYGMEEDVARSLESGFVEHLVKPLNFEKLEALLRVLLG